MTGQELVLQGSERMENKGDERQDRARQFRGVKGETGGCKECTVTKGASTGRAAGWR